MAALEPFSMNLTRISRIYFMTTISKALDKFSGMLKSIGGLAVTIMMLLTVVDVIGRYLKHPIFGSVELMGFLAAIVVATALPYTYKGDGHVAVEILIRLFPKKIQHIIEIVTRTLTLALIATMTWQMFLYGRTLDASGEVSMDLHFPIHYLAYLISFGLLVFSFTIIETIFENIQQLRALKRK